MDSYGYDDEGRGSVQLPHSVDSERRALSACLLDPMVIPVVMSIASPDDFYLPQHRVIALALRTMYERGELPDEVLLRDELQRSGAWEAAGGSEFVGPLSYAAPTAFNADFHAERVWKTAELRRHIQEATQYAAEAYRASDPDAVLTAHMERMSKLGRRGRAGFVDYADVLDETDEEIVSLMESPHPPAVYSGIPDLDNHLMGFRRKEMVILCARPGGAKSALGAAIAVNEAARLERIGDTGSVAWVTLEMGRVEQAERLIASAASINTLRMRAGFRLPDGTIYRQEYQRFQEAKEAQKTAIGRRLRMLDTPVSLADLRMHLMREKAERDLRVAILDQFDLLEPEQWAAERRQAELERLNSYSRGLKIIASSLNIVMIVLVQLNREGAKAARPTLENLSGTDRLGRDADIVIACHRPAMYDAERAMDDVKFREFMELNLLKVRAGESNVTIPVRFEKSYTRISPWPYGGEESWPHDESRTFTAPSERGFRDFADVEGEYR